MFKMNLYYVFSAFLIAVLAIQVNAQAKLVKLRFEIEGRVVKLPPKVALYADGEKTELDVVHDSFIVPAHLENKEKLDVGFTADKYDLLFESVYLSKFEGKWVIGVDEKPFDADNVASAQPGRPIKQIYYINFHSLKGDGTRMVVILYKP